MLHGLRNINSDAFSGCTSLTTIDLFDDDYAYLRGNANEFTFPCSLARADTFIASYDNYTFAGTKPTKVIFEPNLEAIGSYSFNEVKDLTEVVINDIEHSRLEDILYGAFIGCTNLQTFKLPNSLKNLETSAFENCESLHQLNLKDTSIEIINPKTFYNCHSLEASKLPDTVTSIWSDAFYRNYNMDYLIIPHKINEIQNRSITEARTDDSKMPVYFECTVAESYEINFGTNWKDNTVQEYFLLGAGEEKIPGYNYWQYDGSGNPEII